MPIPPTTPATFASITLPAGPTGTVLEISGVAYVNCSVAGTGACGLSFTINGTAAGPSILVPDLVALASWSARFTTPVAPAASYTIVFRGVKYSGGGTAVAQTDNTRLDVTMYRPGTAGP